jgi:hypothetical protein
MDVHLQDGRIALRNTNDDVSSGLLTNFIELNPTREAAPIPEVLTTIWIPKAHSHVHRSSPPAPVLSHINAVHTTASHL